ncbi:hypothetical protein DENIT_60558 [Pseudomonas veronii]|nr:hypothetical protein DENIT_60558 [Pseudomonas veronii]
MPYTQHCQTRTYIPLVFDSLKPSSGMPHAQSHLGQDVDVWQSSLIGELFLSGKRI